MSCDPQPIPSRLGSRSGRGQTNPRKESRGNRAHLWGNGVEGMQEGTGHPPSSSWSLSASCSACPLVVFFETHKPHPRPTPLNLPFCLRPQDLYLLPWAASRTVFQTSLTPELHPLFSKGASPGPRVPEEGA